MKQNCLVELLDNGEGIPSNKNVKYCIGILKSNGDGFRQEVIIPNVIADMKGISNRLVIRTSFLGDLSKNYQPKYIIWYKNEVFFHHHDMNKIIYILEQLKINIKEIKIFTIADAFQLKESITIEEYQETGDKKDEDEVKSKESDVIEPVEKDEVKKDG